MSNATITQKFVERARERGVHVFHRHQWNSRLGEIYAERRRMRPHSLIPEKPADTLVQHITVTRPGQTEEDFKVSMRLLENIGLERFGSGISYDGCFDMTHGWLGIGQPLDAKGTHTINDKGVEGFSYDQNKVALGFAVIGMPETELTEKAAEKMAQAYAALVDVGALTRGHDYKPHSFFAYKDCPCDSTRDQMEWINKRVLELTKPRR